MHEFLYNLFEFFLLLDQTFYEHELRAAAVQIVIVAADLEIVVAVEIIGQEAHADFKCDELAGEGKKLDLLFRQAAVRPIQKTFDQSTENFDSDANLGKIGLVLGVVILLTVVLLLVPTGYEGALIYQDAEKVRAALNGLQ